MNLLARAKQIVHGLEILTTWVGEGGEVAPPEEAQRRADTCNGSNPTGRRCPNNVANYPVTETVALAVKKVLSVKNAMDLRVRGERILGTCNACGCVLRLLVHEPSAKVKRELSDEEKAVLPAHCWKLSL